MPLRHSAEMVGIARWLKEAGEWEAARTLLRRAVDTGLSDGLLFPTLWDLAAIERKLREWDSALEIWNDLAAARNPFRARALEELAKHHEHRLKDYEAALAYTKSALDLDSSADLRHRAVRLRAKIKSTCQKPA